MANQPKPLVIEAPRQGIAPSPHVGFGNMQNIDIFSKPGVALLNNILAKESATTVDAQVKWIVKNPASPANLYALDSSGVVYTSANSGDTWSELSDRGGAGQGLAVWKDYLFVAEGATIDVYGPLSSSPSWSNNWQSLSGNDSLWQPMLVSKLDGKLYIGNGRYIDSVAEEVGQDFAPGTGATFAFVSGALTLPEDYRVKCLAEQNNNLMVGTWMGTNIYDNKIADIFPWDGSSTSYNDPIQMVENGVNAMLNISGNLYILAGIDGMIHKSNGVQAWPIGKIPNSVADTFGGKYLEPYPGAIMNFEGRLHFGVSSQDVDGMGIYSLLETSSGNIVNCEHTISTGTTGGTNPLIIGALLGISRDKFVCGWRDNATYGIDLLSKTAYSTDYSGFFDSPLYQIGTYLDKRKYSMLDFTLVKELLTGEGIKFEYRVNLTDSWTELGTYTTADIGVGKTSFHEENIDIPEAEQIEIRVSLKGTSTTTPEYKQLILN